MSDVKDIDQITATVRERVPDVEVDQWIKLHPDDDDGIWYFRRPGVKGEIQLESSSGNCPFTIESDAMPRTSEVVKAPTTGDAVKLITEFLAGVKKS